VEYAIVLDEETLLFFAEVLVTQRLLCKVAEATANGPREGIMAVWLQGVNESAFKELFQEPLKHRAFRKKLLDHFSNHPNFHLRSTGAAILESMLTWDT
jgi:hypothetical protein